MVIILIYSFGVQIKRIKRRYSFFLWLDNPVGIPTVLASANDQLPINLLCFLIDRLTNLFELGLNLRLITVVNTLNGIKTIVFGDIFFDEFFLRDYLAHAIKHAQSRPVALPELLIYHQLED